MAEEVHFGLVGAGGFGREVMPWALVRLNEELAATGQCCTPCFVETAPTRSEINGIACIAEAEFIALPGPKVFNVAIADWRLRRAIAERLSAFARPVALVDKSATVLERNEIGPGVLLCPYAMVTSNARIGRFFHANIYAYVAHDCVVGDYVTFAPAVKCNGNVRIGDHVYVGTGAILRNGTSEAPLEIGDRAVIGMGAVVTRNVPADTTVVGNPARPLPRKA